MNLADFTSEHRRKIFDELSRGIPPSTGEFSLELFKEGKDKGSPQMGSARYEPDAVLLEYIYPIANEVPVLLTVRVDAPERIVYMPVPEWVVESVWEGDVSGTFRFESEAQRLLERFAQTLTAPANEKLFYERVEIGRS